MILVVEANADIRENLVELLTLAGYSVKAVENGKTAVEVIKEIFPDFVICDIKVPDLSGYEILEFLKSNVIYNIVHLIFLTTSTDKYERNKAMMLGADGYLGKPFEEYDLLSTIDVLSTKY